jgi:hypothetical protein
MVLENLLTVDSLYEGIPQQHGEVMMVQTPHAQPVVLEGIVRVVYHLR